MYVFDVFCVNYCMMVCMSYCMYDVNVCVLRQIAHRCRKKNEVLEKK